METELICIVCFNDLPEGHKIFCGRECYCAYHGLQVAKDRKGPQEICMKCGKPFPAKRVPGGPRRRFCSWKCRESYIAKQRSRGSKVLARLINELKDNR
jgi:predicted nucleic acid-binding Zn ribbon protein